MNGSKNLFMAHLHHFDIDGGADPPLSSPYPINRSWNYVGATRAGEPGARKTRSDTP
jgi:hypothetical protein